MLLDSWRLLANDLDIRPVGLPKLEILHVRWWGGRPPKRLAQRLQIVCGRQSCRSRAIGGPTENPENVTSKPSRCGEQHIMPTSAIFEIGK